jgi:hypothetical protein
MTMARRSSQSGARIWPIFAVVLIAAAFLGAIFIFPRDSNPYRTVPELEVGAYLENANSLRGNVYRVEGEVLNSLAWSPASGRLIAVGVGKGNDVLPVLVTTEFNQINIQKGQKFIFLLEIDENGILKTKNLTKS